MSGNERHPRGGARHTILQKFAFSSLFPVSFGWIFLIAFLLAGCPSDDNPQPSQSPSRPPATYTIRVLVSGYLNSGLVLQNNGGDNLVINANGGVFFPIKIANGSGYNVTVLSNPPSPSQTCTVTNGSGTVAGADVRVSVSCATNSYSIGGTVSGLGGTGLVLRNNSGDNLAISANGPFTFAAKILDWWGYSVTVLTQPGSPSQTCTVNSGSGILAGANVTNVAVVCTPDTYTVGGTISGLTGTGLVLQNNGGDDLGISSNGTFAFAVRVLGGGGGFNVTVLTQPSGPSQTCAVTNGTGTIAGANYVGVSVVCSAETYSIGGTVSGLAGTGLVLQNRWGDNLAISANGAFTFATKILDGTGYRVTVQTRPTGLSQSCAVSNAIGTVAGADVTNVSVVCTTRSFGIQGNISGMEGAGLVLQNNDADDLAITKNGMFRFLTPVLDGTGFNVTVLNPPSGPSQTCTVSNGSGTIAGASVLNVSMVCATNSYSIGGTVSGLGGTGLVLLNNGGDNIAIATDGSFTFVTLLLDGSGYHVTVLTQSTGQVCPVSGGTSTLAGANVTGILVTCITPLSGVSALYGGNGSNWNDYVVDDGASMIGATDTACNAATDTACLHGGELRVFEVVAKSSCTGLSAEDNIGAFDWICDDSTGTARMISTGLRGGKGLADLMDFNTPGWRENSLAIYDGPNLYGASSSTTWWANPVVANTTGGTLDALGTVYVVPSNTSATAYAYTASKVALVAAPGVVIDGPGLGEGSYVLSATGLDFIWVEGMTINALGDDVGVYWDTVRFSAMRNLTAKNADTGTSWNGVRLVSSSNNRLSGVTASNNGSTGIYLETSSNNTLSVIILINNSWGLVLSSSSGNTLSNVTAANHSYSGSGIYLLNSSNNTLSNVNSSNNGNGVSLAGSSNNTLSGVNASNNNGNGVELSGSSNNTLSGVTASNNNAMGVEILNSPNNTLSNATASNNGSFGVNLDSNSNNSTLSGVSANYNSSGIHISDASNNTVLNVTLSNNDFGGIGIYSSGNYFTGQLLVGNNSWNCSTSIFVTNEGLVDGTCANEGLSDATLITGVTIAGSFVAWVTSNDSANTSDTDGAATLTDIAQVFDWVNFENPFRAWGLNSWTFSATTSQGRLGCSDITYTSELWCEFYQHTWRVDARIWDWSLLTTGTVIKDALPLPTGNDTLTHTWSDASTTTFLRNAVEIMGDGIGNDNTLCETGEDCLYTPNMGSYQGHGNLISAGSIGTGGTIENVTLWKYETNGY